MTTPTIVTPADNPLTANCYASIAEADAYFAGKFGGESWEVLDADQKTRLLITASRRIDAERFSGVKTPSTASLQWPRSGMIDNDGNPVTSTNVPSLVKMATFEQAFYYNRETDVTMIDPGSIELFESVKIGSIDLKTRQGVTNLLCQEARNFLKQLGQGNWVGETSGSSAKSVSMFR